ncbi:hypothetical protein [Altererythrobacter sp. B11]|nr:hypothetical protein [Altererythrobacter sp. B11]
MRDWEMDEDETGSGWFLVEVTLATVVVFGGYVGFGWTAVTWLVDHLA